MNDVEMNKALIAKAILEGKAVEAWLVHVNQQNHPQLYWVRPTADVVRTCHCGCGHKVEVFVGFPNGGMAVLQGSVLGKVAMERGPGAITKIILAVAPE